MCQGVVVLNIFHFQKKIDVCKKSINLIIISLTLFFSLLIIAITPPAEGYELSIYGIYPLSFWLLISINIFLSFYSILQFGNDKSWSWIFGYFSLLLIENIILLLPIIRGYFSMNRGGGDIYHHILIANYISNSGYIPQTDIYPIMHIFLSILHISLLDWINLSFLISIIFFNLYVLYLYILGKTILGTKRGGIFISIFGIPLIFSFLHYGFFPFFFALLTIPLILYIYQKSSTTQLKNKFYISLILLLFFIVFCHPSISLFLLVTFSFLSVYEIWREKRNRMRVSKQITLNIVFLLFISISFWFIQVRSLLNTMKKIFNALIGEYQTTTIIQYQLETINSSNATIWLILERYIKIYGPITAYYIISFLFIIYLIKNHNRLDKTSECELVYSLQFFGALFINIAMLIVYIVIFEPIRAFSYSIFFATIICGFFFNRIWDIINSIKKREIYYFFITFFISLLCLLCILNLYSNPWIGTPNTAFSYKDKNGLDWILRYGYGKIPLAREDYTDQYSNYYYGVMNSNNTIPLSEFILNGIPSNFGYTGNSTIGKAFTFLHNKNSVYIETTKKMKLTPYAVPVERRDLIKQFKDEDFILLNNDPTANLIYSNSEVEIRVVTVSI